jgi:hypothetical protein
MVTFITVLERVYRNHISRSKHFTIPEDFWSEWEVGRLGRLRQRSVGRVLRERRPSRAIRLLQPELTFNPHDFTPAAHAGGGSAHQKRRTRDEAGEIDNPGSTPP